jgi:rSAM/selenodomain-associated transferase 1
LRANTRTAPDATLIVFAKAPVPGRAKTRLIPSLGADGAARLHARLIELTVRTALGAGFRSVELHCTPGVRHPLFQRLAKRHALVLRAQRGADLGARMQHACERALRRSAAVVLIGTDCPVLAPADLRAARGALLAGFDAVLAPAEDGGYALIGVRRVSSRIFSGIEWGGPAVMQQTRVRLRSLGWRWRELRTLWDVDRPDDTLRLKALRKLSAPRRRARR